MSINNVEIIVMKGLYGMNMMNTIKFAGVVILYHPGEDVLDNIDSYIRELDRLYILDNTEKPNDKFKEQIDKRWAHLSYKYIAFNENKGISFGLNYALQQLYEFDFLLTMDQDSKFLPNMMGQYKKNISKINRNDIAMYAVNLDMRYISPLKQIGSETKIVETAITSGSILNIKIANKLGGFDENLFIDEVDLDFCHNANMHGYKIIQFMNVLLHHKIGNPELHQFIWKKVIVYNHSAIRKYYIIRNRIYMMKKYPFLKKKYFIPFIKILAYTVLYEKKRIKKIHYIFMGGRDAFKCHMGSFFQWHKVK